MAKMMLGVVAVVVAAMMMATVKSDTTPATPVSVDCYVCLEVIGLAESIAKKGLTVEEGKLIDYCKNFVQEKTTLTKFEGDLICSGVIKTGIDLVIEYTENPTEDLKDAKTICGAIAMC